MQFITRKCKEFTFLIFPQSLTPERGLGPLSKRNFRSIENFLRTRIIHLILIGQ